MQTTAFFMPWIQVEYTFYTMMKKKILLYPYRMMSEVTGALWRWLCLWISFSLWPFRFHCDLSNIAAQQCYTSNLQPNLPCVLSTNMSWQHRKTEVLISLLKQMSVCQRVFFFSCNSTKIGSCSKAEKVAGWRVKLLYRLDVIFGSYYPLVKNQISASNCPSPIWWIW